MSLNNKTKIRLGLTYDDVLLEPAYSEVLPNEVSLKTKFTRNIPSTVYPRNWSNEMIRRPTGLASDMS